MRRIMKRAASLVLATALVVTGIYCGGTDAQAAKKAKKITMNKKTVNITVGGKFKLTVKKVTPKKASKAVTYKSKNSKIAKVTKKGVITGKKVGSTTITVTSKTNKKAKATVKVKVRKNSPVVTPTPVANPTATATVVASSAPTNGPTGQPTATPVPTKTPRPTGTPKPPATPTPKPTPPGEMLSHGSAPITLTFSDDIIQISGENDDAEKDEDGNKIKVTNADGFTVNKGENAGKVGYKINEDGSVTMFVGKLYCGIGFLVPEAVKENNFDTVTVTYKDATNVGFGYGCGLWRDANDQGTEDVIAWNGVFAQVDEETGNPITEGEYVASIAGKKDTDEGTKAWYANKILLFNNDESVYSLNPSAQVTITKIVFSHSEYQGGSEQPTTPPENTSAPDETPTPDFAAKKISTPVIVDGDIDEVWENVPELPIEHKVLVEGGDESETTATAKIAWDEDNLYGLVKVTDKSVVLNENKNPHERDGIEFFLDEDYSMDGNANTDAFQYRLTGLKADGGNVAPALTNDIVTNAGVGNTAKEDYKEKIQIAYKFTDDGYVVEFKITFKEAKQAGALVGFDIIVQDCKEGKRDAEIYLRNTDEALSYWNLADTFGTLKLEDDAEEPGPDIPEAL